LLTRLQVPVTAAYAPGTFNSNGHLDRSLALMKLDKEYFENA